MSLEKIIAGFPNGELRTSHPFYMADAINDIPGCLEACLSENALTSMQKAMQHLKIKRIFTVGCGTSYNTAQVIAYASRTLLHIRAEAADSLDFLLDPPCGIDSEALIISMSHSGQTLVTCQAQEKAKSQGAFTVAISGEAKSRLLQHADLAITDPYAVEVPFGKTRSYLSASLQGMLVAMMLASPQQREDFIRQAKKMVASVRENMAEWESAAISIASKWANLTNHYMLAGFGVQKANADEIGLKIIEVIGEGATGYGLEEFTHGPSASFRTDMGIFLFQTDERVLQRAQAVANAVALSEATLAVFTDDVTANWPESAHVVQLPALDTTQQLGVFPAAVAAQFLMYHLAVKKGLIPDINGIDLRPEMEAINDVLFPPGTH